MSRLRTAQAARPLDPAPAIDLARKYFDLALAEGDPRYVGYAEAALHPWRSKASAPPEVLIVSAQLAQYRHEFDLALRYFDQVLAADPGDPEALAWRAAVFMVLANYPEARKDCERLALVASALLATGCATYVEASTGGARSAYARLLDTFGRHPSARATLRLWCLTLLAEMARRLGDPAAADAHYRQAMRLGLTDQYLLAAYAEFLEAQGRWRDAAELLRPWERSDVLLLLLARAERALGDPAAARHARTLAARFDAAARRGDRLHVQDEALYRLEFLGDAKGALVLAKENWSRQKEPRDAELLLEAALAAKDPTSARPALEWRERWGIEDPRLAQLAAAIARLPK